MRPRAAHDRPQQERFLRRQVAPSMFPLGNLPGCGMATEVWLAEGPDGLAGYLGRAANGNLPPQWPGGDWAQTRPRLAGREAAGLVGPPAQVQALVAAIGLDRAAVVKSETEPGFTLSLDALRCPEGAGCDLRPVAPPDAERLIPWRIASHRELTSADAATAQAPAQDEARRMIREGTHRLLWHKGQPVAMAGISLTAQGGICTPPALRSQGYARRAVALMLAHLRGQGVHTALLSAASDTAARACRALGFRPSRSFAIHPLAQPEAIPCP